MAAERLDIEEFFRKIDLRVIMNILSANFGETCRYGPLNDQTCHVYRQLDHVSAARVHA